MIELNYILPVIFLIPLYLIYGIKPYIFGLHTNQLFSHGKDLDFKMKLYYQWIFYLRIYKIIPDSITVILILDQISRHVFRYNSELIDKYTFELEYFIDYVMRNQYQYLSLKEKAFLSLATRHLLRTTSQLPEYKGSDKHKKISKSLSDQMELLDIYIKEYQKYYTSYQFSPDIINDCLETSIFVKNVNSENLKVYRCHQYIDNNYQVWKVKPVFDINWILKFNETKISKYFQSRLINLKTKFPDKDEIHIYLMISGGIDSMTMARIVLGILYKNSQNFQNFKFHGLHINWQKRNESTLEADTLEDFFEKYNEILSQKNKSIFDFQVIDSTVNPNDSNWEQKSTDFRINTLQSLDKLNANNTSISIFALGHVVEDLVENLICNSTMEGVSTGKQTYLDLFGMRELIKRKVYLFRPFLLYSKPKDDDTPHFLDNAQNLDVKRRVIRRAIKEYNYDLSRIKQIYSEFEELTDKYSIPIVDDNNNNDNNNDNDEYHTMLFKIDWTPTEWRYVLNNYMGERGYPNLKRNSITQLYQRIRNSKNKELKKFKVSMSKPFIREQSFEVNMKKCVILIPNIRC